MKTLDIIHKHEPVKIILFDLLTALLDSWTLWNSVAGSEEKGRVWRAAYLKATYGCGAYRPYETLVEEAAVSVGLEAKLAHELEARWPELQAWPEVKRVLQALEPHYKLGVVTNCSQRLGRIAADLVGVPFDVVVTSEQAGFYKPHPEPYLLALRNAGFAPAEAIFVAGSAYDMFGTQKVGLPTYWHNRVGLTAPEGAPSPFVERSTLDPLLHDIESLARS